MRQAAILLLMVAVACSKREGTPAAAKKAGKPVTPAAAETAPRTEVGDRMPDYSAEGLDGKPFHLASEKGNVVLLNVWATWCGPCRMEMPELQRLHDHYRDRGFKVVGVSVDDSGAESVKQFVTAQKIAFPIAIDPEGKLANILQTTVIPTSVIVDRSGKIVWRQVGAVQPNDVAGVQKIIEAALAARS